MKAIRWVGSSHDDLLALPAEVRRQVGYALYVAQKGDKADHTKPLKGFGGGVLEVVEDHDGDTYRAVYTLRFASAVYVLHAFQKKSKAGDQGAEEGFGFDRNAAEGRQADGRRATNMDIPITEGGPNVFADLGLPDAEEMLVKAQLAHQIARDITARGLTQSEAATIIGLPQPKLSNMLRGKFRGISEDKMMRCLVALGHVITINVSPANDEGGRVEVACA